MSLDEDEKAALLEAVFEHYGLDWPRGYGQKSIHCPVHDDRNASATVNTGLGLWSCFACQKGGDAYTLIMERDEIGFTDAASLAESLLDRSGREVRYGSSRKSRSGVPGSKGRKPGGGGYRPSWMDR